MIAINCIKCKKEFKISRADFDERHKNKVPDFCGACMGLKPEKKANVNKKPTVKKTIKPKGK